MLHIGRYSINKIFYINLYAEKVRYRGIYLYVYLSYTLRLNKFERKMYIVIDLT